MCRSEPKTLPSNPLGRRTTSKGVWANLAFLAARQLELRAVRSRGFDSPSKGVSATARVTQIAPALEQASDNSGMSKQTAEELRHACHDTHRRSTR
jgi:hypothetical protein